MDWKAVVRDVAPTLAGVLGTPALGLGVKVLTDALLGESSGDPVKDEASIAGILAGGLTPELRAKLIDAESRVKEQLFELRKLGMQNQRAAEAEEVTDRQDARKRDAAFIAAGTRNYRADGMFLVALILVAALTYLVWKSPDLNEYAKGIFTLVLGRFLGYIDNAYQFEFGTTRNNRAKDVTIEQLSRGKE